LDLKFDYSQKIKGLAEYFSKKKTLPLEQGLILKKE